MKKQQFTVILTGPQARNLHLLAEHRGLSAGALFRAWLAAEFTDTFGKEVA